MPTQYRPERKTIGELLSMTNPPILVPNWQRNFSWTTSEVDTFWQDMTHGSLIFGPVPNMDQRAHLCKNLRFE